MKKIIYFFFICLIIAAPILSVSASYVLEMDYPTFGGASPQQGLVEYIRYLYLFGLSIVGLAAFGAMIYGGVNYMLAGANLSSQTEAKKWFFSAISGLVLALASYLIIYTINPALVSINAPKVDKLRSASSSNLPTAMTISLLEGDECVKGATDVVCQPGLICEEDLVTSLTWGNGTCVKDPNYVPPTQSASCQWQKIDSCFNLNPKKAVCGSNLCPASKPTPEIDYQCCGI